jgi:hypothetical protein
MAIERAVDGTDSRLRLVPGYRKRLREPVIHAIDQVVALVDGIPATVPAGPGDYRNDFRLTALFASADDMLQVFGRDKGPLGLPVRPRGAGCRACHRPAPGASRGEEHPRDGPGGRPGAPRRGPSDGQLLRAPSAGAPDHRGGVQALPQAACLRSPARPGIGQIAEARVERADLTAPARSAAAQAPDHEAGHAEPRGARPGRAG